MPEVALSLVPGVNVEKTYVLNQSGISACQLIRFKQRLPQKLGGWTRYFPSSFSGKIRALHPWGDLNGAARLAVGATDILGVITSGSLQDITPQKLTSNFSPNFSTTATDATVTIVDPNINNVTTFDAIFFNTPVSVGGVVLQGAYPIATIAGATSYTIESAAVATGTVPNAGAVPVFDSTSGSAVITVTLNNHGLSVGDLFTFPISTTVGGVTILGTYPALSVPTANTFTISGSVQASGTATVSMNSGNAELVYYLNLGPAAGGVGFGVGAFGVGGFGSGIVPSSQTGTPITATDWTIDNWGQTLLACPRNGGIYAWTPNTGFQNAGLVPGAPIFNGGIFVAMPEQILVAWGSTTNPPEQQDPLEVRWSDSLDYTNWIVTSTTQAGSFRIPEGSKIMGGLQGPQQALIWTDLAVWAMVYQGLPFVFGFNKISEGCGLVGPHAAAIMRGAVYWMSSGNFFVLSGGVAQPLPCSVWDVVFQNLDADNESKCVAAPNSTFDEMTFYYPSRSGGGEIDSYVKYNIDEQTWDYGTLSRTAWIDQSVLGQPIGASAQGLIFQHETSDDADGQPLNWYFETGWFRVADGQDFTFIDWIFPDMKFGKFGGTQNATVLMTISTAAYPNSTPKMYGPFTMTAAKTFINCRLRNRLIKLRFEGNDVGTFARLGQPMYRAAPDGRR